MTEPLPRRLVMTSLMTGLTLATVRVDAQVIHTDTAGLDVGEAMTTVPTYYARPQGNGPFPIVLVNEEVFGVTDYIKDVCRRLARVGYLAVAPEIYARLVDTAKLTSEAEVQAVVGKAPDATVMSDLDAAMAWAAANKGDASRAGVTGFCRGGRNTWLYDAHSTTVKAAVVWYGVLGGARTEIQPRTAADMATEIHAPLLALQGGQDRSISVADLQAAAARARAAGKTVEVVVYPDAGHGFHADYRPSYRPADAADGWQRMLAWFRRWGVA